MDIAEDPSCNSHQLEDRPTSGLIFISLSGLSRRAVSSSTYALVLKSSPSSLGPGRGLGREYVLRKNWFHKELI
jgi:hypothetical protein